MPANPRLPAKKKANREANGSSPPASAATASAWSRRRRTIQPASGTHPGRRLQGERVGIYSEITQQIIGSKQRPVIGKPSTIPLPHPSHDAKNSFLAAHRKTQ